MIKMKLIKIFLSFGIIFLSLIFLIYNLDLNNFYLIVKSINMKLIFFAIILLIANNMIHAIRWQFLLSSTFKLPFKKSFNFIMIGVLFNAVLPMRPGEIIRIFLLKKFFGKGIIVGAGSITIERIFDVLILLIFSGFVLVNIELPKTILITLELFFLLFLFAFTILFLIIKTQGKLLRYFLSFIKFISKEISTKLVFIFDHLAEFLKNFCSLKQFSCVFILSFLSWSIVALAMISLIASFNLSVVILPGILVMVVTNLGAAVPISPASIGVYHALCMLALSIWNIDLETSLAIALVSHGIIVLVQVVGGVIALGIEMGFSKWLLEDLKHLRKASVSLE